MNNGISKTRSLKQVIGISFILVLGALAPMLDTTMVNIAVNSIIADFHTTVSSVQWVVTAYVLAIGIAVPIAGWAVDWVSGKKLYIGALLLFLFGSIIAGFSESVWLLIISRVIQGAGAGMIMSALTTLIVRAAGGENLGKLMSIVGLPAVLAPILGPTIGGLIIDHLDWHWIFYINIPIALFSIVLLLWKSPKFTPEERGKRLDWISVILFAGMFTELILGITKVSTTGNFFASQVLVPISIGMGLLILYVIYALIWPKRALVSLSLFKLPSFSASSLLLLMSGITINGAMLLLPLYYQNIRGVSVVWAGIYLIPQGIGMLLTRTQVGKITDCIGARWIVMTGILLSVLATIPFAFADQHTSQWLLLLALFFRGAGEGAMLIPVMADVYTGLSKKQIPEATISTRMLQNIGGAFGTAILATVVQHHLSDTVPTLSHISGAYNAAFVWAIVGTLIAAIPAWFLSSRNNKARIENRKNGFSVTTKHR
jgi:EmrB/QacA subfamily drug resistance transporter